MGRGRDLLREHVLQADLSSEVPIEQLAVPDVPANGGGRSVPGRRMITRSSIPAYAADVANPARIECPEKSKASSPAAAARSCTISETASVESRTPIRSCREIPQNTAPSTIPEAVSQPV